MPPRSKKRVQKAPTSDKIIARKAKKTTGKVTQQRISATGLTTRVKGHVSASGKRAQARRDSRS